jgi:hypothetical protein
MLRVAACQKKRNLEEGKKDKRFGGKVRGITLGGRCKKGKREKKKGHQGEWGDLVLIHREEGEEGEEGRKKEREGEKKGESEPLAFSFIDNEISK